MIVGNLTRVEEVGFCKVLKPITLVNCIELHICWVAAVEFAPEVFSCLQTGGCVHDRYDKIKTHQTPFPTVVRVSRDADEKQFVLRQYQSIYEDGKGGGANISNLDEADESRRYRAKRGIFGGFGGRYGGYRGHHHHHHHHGHHGHRFGFHPFG